MAHPTLSDIGAFIHAATLALAPHAQAEGTRNGSALQVGDFRSGVLAVFTGTAAGSPTAISIIYKLQSRVDSAGTWVDVANPDGVVYSVELTAADAIKELDVNFFHLEDEHGELRVVEVADYTGGSTPTVVSGAVLVRGGSNRRPC